MLEVNYSPDFGKQLELHPRFMDAAFERLFLDTEEAADAMPHQAPVEGSDAIGWDPLPI